MFKKVKILERFGQHQWQNKDTDSITRITDEGMPYYYRINSNGHRRSYMTLKAAKEGLNINLPNNVGA